MQNLKFLSLLHQGIIRILVLLLFFSILACGSKVSVLLIGEQKPFPSKRTPEQIVFYKEKPDTSYTEIALLSTSNRSSIEDAIKALKKKASEIGADAIVLTESGTGNPGALLLSGGLIMNVEDVRASATAIRFRP